VSKLNKKSRPIEAQASNAVHHCHKEADLQLVPGMSIFQLFGAELHFFG
jgi:hypothetical protein